MTHSDDNADHAAFLTAWADDIDRNAGGHSVDATRLRKIAAALSALRSLQGQGEVTEDMFEAARQASDWVADLRDHEIAHIYLAMRSKSPLQGEVPQAGLVEEARAVITHFERGRIRRDGNAPGHGHQVPGIWDTDESNGDKGGTACEWCAQWQRFKEAALKETTNVIG